MNYYKQVLTVTVWEYRRFFKLKNELLGIGVMLFIFFLSYFGGRYLMAESPEKKPLAILENTDPVLRDMLAAAYRIEVIPMEEKEAFINRLASSKQKALLMKEGDGFVIHAWKKPARVKKIQEILDSYTRLQAMQQINLSADKLENILKPAVLAGSYLHETGRKGRVALAYIFAGLMLMAVFLSFAYQFTAITGEKQLKITEQIVSAIKPQAWMDGKILGITLTGLSSMAAYSLMSILGGMLFFQFTGASVGNILQYLHLPSILLFFAFTLLGILLWNAMLAAVASMITDPNNSGKSSLMLLPVLFVASSFLVMRDPDSGLSVFLSWFPLTSASAMPMRWVATEVEWWQLAGSYLLLVAAFYSLRRLAAKIFRVSILISGKEPTLREIIRSF